MKKKLTDEEIVKSLECCVKHRDNYPCDCGLENKICDDDNYLIEILDLIHRLQDENKALKDEKEDIRLFNLAIENGEIDMRIESEMAKSFYNSIVQAFEQNGAKNFFTTTIDIEGKKGRYAFTIEKVGGQTVAEKLAEQNEGIEWLTEQLHGGICACVECWERYEKQVDKLKEECEVFKKLFNDCDGRFTAEEIINTMNTFYREQAEHLAELKIEQAVKDTAKEIWDFAKDFFEWDEEGFVRELKEVVERFGVEVE